MDAGSSRPRSRGHSCQPPRFLRKEDVAAISRHLTLLAKDLRVPVIALSQLTAVLNSARTSGRWSPTCASPERIENCADLVILLHREDAYEEGSLRSGEANLIVGKHRNGPTATITVAFQDHYSRFVDKSLT
ncbi:DnaB-like helicase C-terminal domain-containing protein [Streptomyces sp. NPDC047082]|uniref:DnaB-like helicase C-terminal domain-containing protein n=1 Tax=Streptomyces sp. NPDC047082 TaxID=3155259 RepID=UPI0033C1F41E